MITKKRVWELMKQAGLDEQKYYALLAKEEPQLTDEDMDMVAGGASRPLKSEELAQNSIYGAGYKHMRPGGRSF